MLDNHSCTIINIQTLPHLPTDHHHGQVPQSIGKLAKENFPNFAGVYKPHFAINSHFLSNYECSHSVLCNLTFTLFVLATVTVDGFSLVSDPMKISDCGTGP